MMNEITTLVDLYEAEFEDGRSDAELEIYRSQLQPEMLARYDSLKQRFGKSVLIKITNGACEACHMHLPGTRILITQTKIVDCESCGRLLYDPEVLFDLLFAEDKDTAQ